MRKIAAAILLLFAATATAQNPGRAPLTRGLADALYAALGAPIPATTCTNQFLDAIAATGAGHCATLTLASMATQATNTVLGNVTSGTAAPTALPVASCSSASSALTWTTNTGFGCNSAVATSANNLSFFSSTTSAQLLTLISNETGSGLVMGNDTPTILTPTIASFTNATHNHQNAAGGGTLDTAAIGSGTLGIARGGTGNTSGTATVNANLTGAITSVGNATSIASQTGTGTKFVMDQGPTIAAPTISGNTTYSSAAFLNTSSSLQLRDVTTNNRTVLRVMPNGTVANSPGIFELYGTDLSADGTNYERLSIGTKGSGDTNLVIASQSGGSGTVRPLQLTTGANAGFVIAADGSASYGGALSVTGAITPPQAAGIVGTTTNNNANAGAFGEYFPLAGSGTVAANTTSLSTGTTANVGTATNITLTAGDWDCTGAVNFTFGATTSITNLAGGISTTTGTLPAQDSYFDYETSAMVPTGTAVATWAVPTVRILVSGSTSVFLVAQATFTLSTIKVGGTIRCRRMR